MSTNYDSAAIEILSGLDPVRKRPGMYTDTTCPNHLAQEVIDNSVDEALAGHAKQVNVTLFKDGSLQVEDDGRGMPVDKHPEQKKPGVEVILTTLHAGGKFSNQMYQFSGGLHGVGVSVVNALSARLEVWVRRTGKEYNMSFANGDTASKLEVVGSVGKRNTGTTLRFWPDKKYFDTAKFSEAKLLHLLRAKAVLCSGLHIRFNSEVSGEEHEWCYEDGIRDYLVQGLEPFEVIPETPMFSSFEGNQEAAEWAIAWVRDGQDWITEMVKPFQEPTIQMVAGPVALTGKRLFQRWQKMEFATLQAIGAILIRKGHPSMANGANLAYRKSAFEAVAGFEGIDQTPSGDDELLLMKVQNAFPGSITFRKAAGAMVTTAALERWQDFKNQRLRWASKWQVGRRRSAMSVALFVFVLNLSWFLLPLLAFAGLVSSDDVLGIWRLRFVIEALWVMWLTRFFVSALSIRAFYLHQFLYPVYVIYFGLMANFGNYHWKGRSYKVRWQ